MKLIFKEEPYIEGDIRRVGGRKGQREWDVIIFNYKSIFRKIFLDIKIRRSLENGVKNLAYMAD